MQGDEPAFTRLIDDYSSQLYKFVLHITGDQWLAEEVVQDTFTKIWLNREALGAVKNFRAYLFVISKNFALKALQTVIKQEGNQIAWKLFYERVKEGGDDREAALLLIEEAVRQLPPQQAKVWELARMKGFSYFEIAQQLNISSETVKKHLQAAKQFIISYVKSHIVFVYILLAGIIF
jgi:RNA polymerase sigma-70 factor (ECF subfamily)